MPRTNGAELAREAQTVKPPPPILVASRHAEVEGVAPDRPRLTTTFRTAALAASVAALIPPVEGR